ncbi:MAG: hypothetical protein AUG84_02015 [Chloroflexi bacterium 13_1_20CM_4_66_7]|nr:MAG: hypothetical protein AUG84_02015 [Chloroflexi bacterium 13_1_20CM_4_66_7]
MKALTFRAEGEVKMADVPKPRIAASTDALIRITLGAVCGSDLHILHGHTPMNEGAVLGHEFVGLVEEVGPEVKRFKPDFGGLGGGQAEYVVVPLADHSMEIIPEGMTDEQAIFVGDILSTGFFGAERAEIKPGDTVAVVGAGPVGLMATMCAQLFGPARTFVIDMVESRLEVAQELGGIPINAKEVHPVAAIEKATGGIGADSSIEAVGLLSAVDTAINCVRGGGTISMVGVPSAVLGDFPYLRMWMKSLTFRAGWCNVQLYMRPLLDLIAAGRLRPELIISHRMKLDQAEEAYRIFDAREATKIVLTP